MREIISDERFLELFGNEPYPDFSPDCTDYCANYCKVSYQGIRPLDFKQTDSANVMEGNEDMNAIDVYGVLPAVLLGMLRKPEQVNLDGWSFHGFHYFFDIGEKTSNFFSGEFYPDCFRSHGYEATHIQYMISMFEELATIVSDEEELGFLKPRVVIAYCVQNLKSLL